MSRLANRVLKGPGLKSFVRATVRILGYGVVAQNPMFMG